MEILRIFKNLIYHSGFIMEIWNYLIGFSALCRKYESYIKLLRFLMVILRIFKNLKDLYGLILDIWRYLICLTAVKHNAL